MGFAGFYRALSFSTETIQQLQMCYNHNINNVCMIKRIINHGNS